MTERRQSKPYKMFAFASASFALMLIACGSVSKSNQSDKVVAADAGELLKAELSSQEVVDGTILVITATLAPEMVTGPVRGEFGETQIPFYPVPAMGKGVYQAVMGVPFLHKPGPASLRIYVGEGAELKAKELEFTVIDGQYPSEHIRVAPKHVKLSPKNLKRHKRERVEVGAIYRTLTTEKLWDGPFVLPINSPITSQYGTRRMYNGEMQSAHQGIDLKAAIGAPIRSPAGAIVSMAKNLFLTGNTVILDHGFGVFTIYAHLNKMKVKKGQRIKAGKVIGLAGMTGRASGPHLHWGAVIHREKVNPMELTKVMR